MRPDRRRWAGALLVLLMLAGGLLWWGSDRAPPTAPAAVAKRERVSRSQQTAQAPRKRPVETPEDRSTELAIPVGDSGQPLSARPIPGRIHVEIVYPSGDLARDTVRVFSPDCYASDVTSTGELSLVVIAQTCTLRAGRRDGALWALSDAVAVDVVSGVTTEVELVLPEERTGGLGVQIMEREEGIEIMDVLPGTPADRAGLEKGDIIVEVDGLPTEYLTAEEFIEVMTGPEGTDVAFVIAYEADTGWEEEEHTVTRTMITRDEP